MSDQERLFRMEVDPQASQQEIMLGEFVAEVGMYDTESLEALREAELQSMTDSEARIHRLNTLIEARA